MARVPDKGRLSAEARARISAANMGNKKALGSVRSKATRELMRKTKLGNKFCLGRTLSAETRAKISAALRGRPNANKGKTLQQIMRTSRRSRRKRLNGPIARTTAERIAAMLAVPVLEHPTLRGAVPDYATDRVVFFYGGA